MNIASDPKSHPAQHPALARGEPGRGARQRHRHPDRRSRRHRRQLAQAREDGVPAECAGVVKADAYGCGIDPVARALANAGCKTFFVATLDEARVVRAAAPAATIYVLDGFFQNTGDSLRRDRLQARDRRSQRTRRMGRVLPPLRLDRRRRHPHRHRHEPARPHRGRGAGHHPAHQCRRSRHHAGDEPSRLRRTAQQSAQRQAARDLPRDRQPVLRRAGVAGEFVRHLPRGASSSST